MAAGRSSRRSILIVAAVAVVMAVGGFLAAKWVISPEDAAARTAPPAAGPITVPVEKKALNADVVTRGDIGFTGSTEVKLAEGGGAGGAAVITGRVPEVGSQVDNGTVLLEVTGRPVIALSGELPTYRSLVPGSSGPDVQQLEATLAGLGYDPGPQDKVYDTATGAAVAKLYQTLGYEPPQPGDDLKAALQGAQAALTSANQDVADAQKAVDDAAKGPNQSQRLALQATVDGAQAAYDLAKVTPSAPDQAAVDEATRGVAEATSIRDGAFAVLQATLDAGEDPTAAQAAYDKTVQDLTTAQAKLDAVNRGGPPSAAAIAEKKIQLDIAKAQQTEGLKVDTTAQKAALSSAQARAATAQTALVAAQAAATTPLPASEIVWLAAMPRRVDEVLVVRGSLVSGAVMRVSGADLSVRGKVSAEEAGLLKTGMTAELTIPGSTSLSAVITQIGGAASGDTSSGTTLVLQPQNVTNEQAQGLRGANVKVTIPVASTSGAVLVVPVAGLFSDSGGTPRVEVLLDDGTTRFQSVAIGLSTGGEVEVRPIDDKGATLQPGPATLDKGSLVVVGR